MKMKKCKECGRTKPSSEYYVHKRAKDGLLNQCKSCVRARVSNHRNENIERIREYDRLRGALRHRKENVRRVYKNRQKDPIKKAIDAARSKEWRERNKTKRACHQIVNNAIRDGRLIKPSTCSRCGKGRRKIHGHHEDYYKPLDVTWLCQPCHGLRHKEINEERRNANT